jgi:hypothetical protein
MQKLIAIRKQSRLQDAQLQATSIEAKRATLVERAQHSDRAE